MIDGSFGSLGLDSIALLNFEYDVWVKRWGKGKGQALLVTRAVQFKFFEYANRIR